MHIGAEEQRHAFLISASYGGERKKKRKMSRNCR